MEVLHEKHIAEKGGAGAYSVAHAIIGGDAYVGIRARVATSPASTHILVPASVNVPTAEHTSAEKWERATLANSIIFYKEMQIGRAHV